MYPLQLIIDVWNTTTFDMFHIKQNAHILRVDVPPPNDHTCMEFCYTKKVSHITECTYPDGRWTLQSPIDHRCMEYCYTK